MRAPTVFQRKLFLTSSYAHVVCLGYNASVIETAAAQ